MRCKTCAILAGGAAKRFGGLTKSKILVGGEPVIERILGTVRDLFSEIFIVTNSPGEFLEYNCIIVPDLIPGIGPLGGIHAALNSAKGEAVFVAAGDMPLLNRDLIIQQLVFFEKGRYDIATPRIGKFIEPLHSVFNTRIVRDVEDFVSGSEFYAVYDFFRLFDVGYFKLADTEENRNVFMNINSPEDVQRVEKILNAQTRQ